MWSLALVPYAHRCNKVKEPIVVDADSSAAIPLPTAPTFAAMQHLISENRKILGYDIDGPIFMPMPVLSDPRSVAFNIVGMTGSGKTTLVLFLLAQYFLMPRFEVMIWDPNYSLANVEHLLHTRDLDTIPKGVQLVMEELNRRKQLRRKSLKYFPDPYLLVIDELPTIAEELPKSIKAIKSVILQGRKYNMHLILSGQGTPADILGKSFVRDCISSGYVLSTTDNQARMAGLDQKSINEFLPIVSGDEKGLAILRSPGLIKKPKIVRIPLVTPDDIELIISGRKSEPTAIPQREQIVESNRASADLGWLDEFFKKK
jgi:hypothetical protein